MPGKNRAPRKLWLHIKAKAPKGITRAMVNDELRKSIQRQDYSYPTDWYVEIGWRNREDAPMKTGEFTFEMKKSAASSNGWDNIVYKYLMDNSR